MQQKPPLSHTKTFDDGASPSVLALPPPLTVCSGNILSEFRPDHAQQYHSSRLFPFQFRQTRRFPHLLLLFFLELFILQSHLKIPARSAGTTHQSCRVDGIVRIRIYAILSVSHHSLLVDRLGLRVERKVLRPGVHQSFATFRPHSGQFREQQSLRRFPDFDAVMLPPLRHHFHLGPLEILSTSFDNLQKRMGALVKRNEKNQTTSLSSR